MWEVPSPSPGGTLRRATPRAAPTAAWLALELVRNNVVCAPGSTSGGLSWGLRLSLPLPACNSQISAQGTRSRVLCRRSGWPTGVRNQPPKTLALQQSCHARRRGICLRKQTQGAARCHRPSPRKQLRLGWKQRRHQAPMEALEQRGGRQQQRRILRSHWGHAHGRSVRGRRLEVRQRATPGVGAPSGRSSEQPEPAQPCHMHAAAPPTLACRNGW